jgi:murein DD-endopeptidase MepM/ murein hydrolase activator NlpD
VGFRALKSLGLVLLLLGSILVVPAAAQEQPPAEPPPPAEEPPPAAEPVEEPPAAEEEPPPAKPARREPANKVKRIKVRYRMTFPVLGPVRYASTFGACRDDCRREHHGNDIMTYGWKGVPVVAVRSGIIERISMDGKLSGCSVHLRHDDRWISRYVHLNNDDPGTDNGEGELDDCVAPGIHVGARVEEGQLLGWVGDSGNSEGTRPHLHFELRKRNGYPVDPYRSLRNARRVRFTRLDPGESPVETAVAISNVVYPEGAPTVFVTGPPEDGFRLPWDPALPGPLLVVDENAIPEVTAAELTRLAPKRVVVFDDGNTFVDRQVVDSLRSLAEIVERAPYPQPAPPPETLPDGLGPHGTGRTRAPFQLVVVDPGEELSIEMQVALADLAETVPLMRLAQPGDIARDRGRSPYSGPGRSGRKATLYFPTGTSYVRYHRSEAPEAALGYGIVVVSGSRELVERTLSYLQSAAEAPAMPVWR